MWRYLFAALFIIAVTIFGFSLIDVTGGSDVSASTVFSMPDTSIDGYARAIEPYDWSFPADYGPHPDFQTEWWYYTGNVKTDTGRHFGYQFTIFRRAITPQATASDSEWRTNQIYMAHFTVSDIDGETFYHDQRFSRGSAELAGATADPRYRVWLEDWEVAAANDEATIQTISAASDDFAVDLVLEQAKVPALQGDGGLSPKSDEPGNASYYYTLSRLITEGTITIDGETFSVSGNTWKDHEFSTSALGNDARGWDWFGLIFDNDTELMVGQIRMVDGNRQPAFGGLLIAPDGSTQYLDSEDFTITPTGEWLSPHTNATYPSGWDIMVSPPEGEAFSFSATPLMLDQELHGANIEYWEGAVAISGDVSGYGYAELTGYVDTMQGRF